MLFSHLKVTIHAQGQAPTMDTQIIYSRKIITLPAPPADRWSEKTGDIGYSDS